MFVELKSKYTSIKCSANRDHPSPTDIKFTQLSICSGLCEVIGSFAVDFRGPDFTQSSKYLNNYV